MSFCDRKDKENFIKIDCNIFGINGHQENGPGDIYEVNHMKDVKVVDQTPSAMEDDQPLTATSANVDHQQNDRLANVAQIRKKIVHGKSWNSRKPDSGSVSDQDVCNPDDNHDVSAKKRKTRRGKPKNKKLKPYSNSLYPRIRNRSNRQVKKSTQPPAPYNTTQFLMEDHSDLPDLEQKLAEATTTTTTSSTIMTTATTTNDLPVFFQKPNAPPRTRDSSFSIDSDEDYFYSSPEDEEEFLTKEFSSAYEDLHAERLSALSKSELIQEYILLEAKLDHITKRMKSKNLQTIDDDDIIDTKTNILNADDVSKKLKLYQQKVDDLLQQNDQLKRDNEALKGKRKNSVSSIDSESDSDSTSSSSSNHSDNDCSDRGDVSHVRRELECSIVDSDSTSSKDDCSSINLNSISPVENEFTNNNNDNCSQVVNELST